MIELLKKAYGFVKGLIPFSTLILVGIILYISTIGIKNANRTDSKLNAKFDDLITTINSKTYTINLSKADFKKIQNLTIKLSPADSALEIIATGPE